MISFVLSKIKKKQKKKIINNYVNFTFILIKIHIIQIKMMIIKYSNRYFTSFNEQKYKKNIEKLPWFVSKA